MSNDNKKKLHISVCAPRKYKKPCKSFGAEGQRENCLLTTDSIENSDCGWCLSERCRKIDNHGHRCSSRRHLVEDHKMKIGVDFEACLEGSTTPFFEVTPLTRDTCSLPMPFGYVTSFCKGPISQYGLPVILPLILACYQGML